MPPSRFSQVSRYRNAVLVSSKPQERFSELGLGAVPDNGVGRLLAVTPVSSHVFARSSTSPNTLLVVPDDGAKKYAKQPPLVHGVCQGGSLGDFDVAKVQEDEGRALLAAGSTSGSIAVRQVNLPEATREGEGVKVTLPAQTEAKENVFSAANQASVNALHFHPGCPSLLLSASLQDDTVQLWNTEAGVGVQEWRASVPQWDVKWSVDGRSVAGAGKDAQVRVWDARSAQSTAAAWIAHQSKVKPIKVSFVTLQTSHLLLTTGFSQMRQREVAIWDQRNLASALKRVTLDVSSSGLEPVCDHDRGMVYFTAKGDSSIRWIDVGSQDQGDAFAEGVYPLEVPAASGALAPAATCDTSTGEIAKLYIASTASSSGASSSSDVIVPSSVRVPRRNYIDFHADLYPDTVYRGRSSATLTVDAWKAGQDAKFELLSMDPSQSRRPTQTPSTNGTQSAAGAFTSQEGPVDPSSTKVDVAQPEKETKVPAEHVAVPALTKKELSVSSTPQTVRDSDISPVERLSSSVPKTKVVVASPVQRSSVAHWSRRPMAGSTPLIAAYQNLSSLDVGRGPDARMMAVSRRFLFCPVSGPGGRLGVHPIEAQGRLPLHLPYFAHGTPLIDFAVDPFYDEQVYTAASDGTIRLWRVPEPVKGEAGLELPAEQLGDACLIQNVHLSNTNGKIAEIVPHPYVQGLVAILPSDAEGKLSLVDALNGRILSSLSVPGGGLFAGVWSFDGSVLAVSAKDRMLYILDVRGSNKEGARVLGHVSAHDSPRSFRPVWIDGIHLLTVGHTVGSLRQLKLYRLGGSDDGGIEELAKHTLDASPSILFPVWDADTNILWLWSKGERIVSAFEVQPDAKAAATAVGGQRAARTMAQQQQQDIFTTLPAFQHAQPQLGLAFLPKDCVDVRNVEVASAVRLSKTDIQRVSWNVPRSRPEYFQDDVYPPTLLVRQPLLRLEEWLNGLDVASPPRISLQPVDMRPLSEAPPPEQRQSSLSKGPTKRQMTEKEQEDAMFQDIFSKAKGNDSLRDPNHNEEQAARAPDNDDWDDDD